MSDHATDRDFAGSDTSGSGLGGFLRSLLAGIPWSESSEGEEVVHLDAPRRGTIKIHNANGRTRVVGEDREDVEICIFKQARAESPEAADRLLRSIRLVYDRTPETLDLELAIPRRWNRHGSANLEIRLPRGLVVELSSANGRLCLEGLRSSVRARSGNGPVSIQDVVGDIDVVTSNAKVKCSCTFGKLVARSSNGRIELGEHRGSVDASTSNGLIHASLGALGNDGVVLATSNGRIALDLPEDVDAEVDIRVDNGIIRNCRSLTPEGEQTGGRVRGRLGRGGTPIKLRTSNGTISVR